MTPYEMLKNLRNKYNNDPYDLAIERIPVNTILNSITDAYFELQEAAYDISAIDTVMISDLEHELDSFKLHIVKLQKRLYNLRRSDNVPK